MWPLIKYLGFFILLGYLFLGYFLDEKKSRPKTSKAFILSLNGSSILFFLATLAKSFQWIDFPEVAVQNFGLSGNPNVFGLISCFTLALHLSLIDRGNLPFAKNLNSLLIILEMITILTTASRASWISGIIIFIYFLFKKNTWKALSIPLLFFICFFSAYHYYLQEYLSSTKYHSQAAFSGYARHTHKSRNIEKRGSLPDRIVVGNWSLDCFLEKPILGHGLGFFIENSDHLITAEIARQDPDLQVLVGKQHIIHNTLLWLLVEFGILGTLPFLCLFIFLTRHFYRYYRKTKDPTVHAVLLMLLTAAFFSLFHEVMYQRVIWFMIGWGLAITTKKAPPEEGALSHKH